MCAFQKENEDGAGIPVGMKCCTSPSCDQPIKPLVDFHKSGGSKQNKDGRLPICRDCRSRRRNKTGREVKPKTTKVGTKVCSRADCFSREQAVTGFGKDARAADGLRGTCKACRKKEHARYFADEEKRQAHNAGTLAHYYAHRGEILAKSREPEKRQKSRDRTRLWFQTNEHARELRKEWSAKAHGKRRAGKLGLPVEDVRLSVLRERDKVCYLCLVPFTQEDHIEQDHVIPLSRTELQPTHTYMNVALTHRTCNRQKHRKTPTEHWAWEYANLGQVTGERHV